MDAVEPGAMPDDWTELRRLAGEATPGPWRFDPFRPETLDHGASAAGAGPAIVTGRDHADADAAYIAAASPDRILRLLDERDRLKR